MGGKKVQLQKGLNWLEAGMSETPWIPVWDWKNMMATLLYVYNVIGYLCKGEDGIVLLEEFHYLCSA